MSEKVIYETDWIPVLDGLAHFHEASQFIRALRDGKIRATGCFVDEVRPDQKLTRKEIDKNIWEDFTFNDSEGVLDNIYEEPDVNILQWYIDIEVSLSDIENLRKKENATPSTDHGQPPFRSPGLIGNVPSSAA